MRLWPRTIRWKMLLGLVLLEALSIGLFALVLVQLQLRDVREHAEERLLSQATSVASQAQEAMVEDRGTMLALAVRMMGKAPSVQQAKVSDAAGKMLYVSPGLVSESPLTTEEIAQIPHIEDGRSHVFMFGKRRLEGVHGIYVQKQLRGFAWVESDPAWDNQQLLTVVRGTLIFGIVWIAASTLLVGFMSRSIAKPLAVLHAGTSALMNSPDSTAGFPLPMTGDDEFGELIEAFNRMVASLEEQRLGLNDTLSLLESILANAPVGLAFFDSRCRCVRANQVFADLCGVPLSRPLGKSLGEILPEADGARLEEAVQRVFATEVSERDLEICGVEEKRHWPWTWLVNTYPIRTTANQVRWVGVIVQDISERKRSEETLRKTEKLAATGRLAASIAHEVNNPLEAITNLLYLLRNFCKLDDTALRYVAMAEHESKRIAEIAQQTLRFYRQSTLPQRANMAELIDSVLDLYHGRINALNVHVQREYDAGLDLFCFAGEVRQVFANFVGNALDAMMGGGGRLVVRSRRSCSWKDPEMLGVRFTVADTGSGMTADVRERVFEAFFTTKEETGTGLGLWVSQEIIQRHRGVVHLRSRAAENGARGGTVFQIFLPDDQKLAQTTRQALS